MILPFEAKASRCSARNLPRPVQGRTVDVLLPLRWRSKGAACAALRKRGSALVAQSAEHFLGKEEVTGSIPVEGFSALAKANVGAAFPRRGWLSLGL